MRRFATGLVASALGFGLVMGCGSEPLPGVAEAPKDLSSLGKSTDPSVKQAPQGLKENKSGAIQLAPVAK